MLFFGRGMERTGRESDMAGGVVVISEGDAYHVRQILVPRRWIANCPSRFCLPFTCCVC